MKKKLLINIGMVIAVLMCGKVSAQSSCSAVIPPVTSDGFYAIDLPAIILGNAQEDLADLRIKDSAGHEVAWLLREDAERLFERSFLPFVTETTSTAKETNVLVETDGRPLSTFTLRMKNADADKRATLRGSNDRKNWYAVKERLSLVNTSHPNLTEVFIPLEFPLSDYRYYMLTIGDSLSAPLNITAVGVMKEGYSYAAQMLDIPVKESGIRTEGKQTNISLVLPYQIKVADIVFYISSPKYYERDVKVWLPGYRYASSRRSLLQKRQTIMQQDYSMRTLTSNDGRPLTLPYHYYTDTLKMEVYNKDDQPLQIDSVKLYTRKLYIVASLKQGMTYRLTCGDEQAVLPQYDLSFATQLPDSLNHLTLQHIKEQPAASQETDSFGWEMVKTYGIWVVIALIILQILFVIRKMVKQTPKQS